MDLLNAIAAALNRRVVTIKSRPNQGGFPPILYIGAVGRYSLP